jgi:hypothetical protein
MFFSRAEVCASTDRSQLHGHLPSLMCAKYEPVLILGLCRTKPFNVMFAAAIVALQVAMQQRAEFVLSLCGTAGAGMDSSAGESDRTVAAVLNALDASSFESERGRSMVCRVFINNGGDF